MHESALAGPSEQPPLTQNLAPISSSLSTPGREPEHVFSAPMEETSSGVARLGSPTDPKASDKTAPSNENTPDAQHIRSSINSDDPNEHHEEEEPISTQQNDNLQRIHRKSIPLQSHQNNEQEVAGLGKQDADPPPIFKSFMENRHNSILPFNPPLPPIPRTAPVGPGLPGFEFLAKRETPKSLSLLPPLEPYSGSRTVNDVLREWLQCSPVFLRETMNCPEFLKRLREPEPSLDSVTAVQIGIQGSLFGKYSGHKSNQSNKAPFEVSAERIAGILNKFGVAYVVEDHGFQCLYPRHIFTTVHYMNIKSKLPHRDPSYQALQRELRQKVLAEWHSKLQLPLEKILQSWVPFHVKVANKKLSDQLYFSIETTAEEKRRYIIEAIIYELKNRLA